MDAATPAESDSLLGRRLSALDERWPNWRRKAGGLAVAVGLETALLLLLLTLGHNGAGLRQASEALTTVDFRPEPPPAEERTPEQPPQQPALPRAAAQAPPDRPVAPQPMPVPAAVIPIAPPTQTPEPAATSAPRIRAVVRPGTSGPTGPANRAAPGDSERVGTASHGEPLYAARWYREPTDQELRGYLSTASGPGYALINCRTVPDFRVEDCELIDEHPSGAQIGRAVMAAAWQFKVRPPRAGGRPLVGAWVRIRITYEMRREAS